MERHSGFNTTSSLGRRTPILSLGDDCSVRFLLHPRARLEVPLVHEEGQLAIFSLRCPVVPDPVHVGAVATLDHFFSVRVDLVERIVVYQYSVSQSTLDL